MDGITEVAPGVFSSFLTTLFVFGALALSMTGDIGKVLYVIPVILILTLSVSLVEAFCILPRHLAHTLSANGKSMKSNPLRTKIDQVLDWIKNQILGRLVDLAIDYRYLFIGLVVLTFIASISMIAGGVLKVPAFPEIDGDVIQARILFPQGTPLSKTTLYVDKLTDAAKKINRDFSPDQPEGRDLVENISVM